MQIIFEHYLNELIMKKINRREFISKAAIGVGGALALTRLPAQVLSQAKAEKGFNWLSDIPDNKRAIERYCRHVKNASG